MVKLEAPELMMATGGGILLGLGLVGLGAFVYYAIQSILVRPILLLFALGLVAFILFFGGMLWYDWRHDDGGYP